MNNEPPKNGETPAGTGACRNILPSLSRYEHFKTPATQSQADAYRARVAGAIQRFAAHQRGGRR